MAGDDGLFHRLCENIIRSSPYCVEWNGKHGVGQYVELMDEEEVEQGQHGRRLH